MEADGDLYIMLRSSTVGIVAFLRCEKRFFHWEPIWRFLSLPSSFSVSSPEYFRKHSIFFNNRL